MISGHQDVSPVAQTPVAGEEMGPEDGFAALVSQLVAWGSSSRPTGSLSGSPLI